ncbi:unnamed protein product, partial [Rotaria sordida]
FDIDRSIIRLLDRNNQKLDNRPSTNRVVRIRTEDILGSIEYRELETQKKHLSAKITILRIVPRNISQSKKKIITTHIYIRHKISNI